MSRPVQEFLDEAVRIAEEASRQKIILRLLGAAGIRYHCPKFARLHDALGRQFTDLDFAAYNSQGKAIRELFPKLGYKYDRRLDMLHGNIRLILESDRFHVDIFFDKLLMNHVIDFKGRLELDYPTLNLTDLFLEKMQIVNITEKDVKDTFVMLREHEVSENEKESINTKYLSGILAKDWGFYYTVTTNLDRLVKEFMPSYQQLTAEDRNDITQKVEAIRKCIEDQPKSMQWKIRAKVGLSKKWYNEVETLHVAKKTN
jgi:hypothetical protein